MLSASNGEEALCIAQDTEHDIKLMITDIVMPQMSGRELAELSWRFVPIFRFFSCRGIPTMQSSVTVCWTKNSTSCKNLSI